MTHKDFELIAQTIRSSMSYKNEGTRRCVAFDFADALAETNPNFDRERFLKACGVTC